MIRNAGPDDVPIIAALGEIFHAEAGWGDIAEYVREDCEKTLNVLLNGEDGILLVAEDEGEIVGMAGGMAHPFYFNHAHKTGMEFFWWVKPGRRNGLGRKLLDAMESEARAKGCRSWAMVALAKVEPELTGRFYRRRGYRPSEHTWIKRL